MLTSSKVLVFIGRCFLLFLLFGSNLSFAQSYVHPTYTRDADADGVPDGRDKCPRTPKGEKVTPFGCPPDSDFDGLYDYQDNCPNEPGPIANTGCPWGDRDKDGIKDNRDRCPDVFGLPQFSGCPDTDGDGLADNEDNCPKQPGPVENQGCPENKDIDGDGVTDADDDCPRTPGPKEYKGCPKLNSVDEAKRRKAFQNLLFETGKAIIKNSSYVSLNGLAEVLNNNPSANLVLEGHTDNVGDDAANMTLSDNRATAVKDYLVSQGINGDRITAEGFGETRPVADNATAAGKQKNRRVEMKIKYE
jgi:OmpA-OmpF porin, OOP family